MKVDTRPIEDLLFLTKENRVPADLELLLREKFADRLPWVSWRNEREGLASLLVNGSRGDFRDLLPAVDAAYDRDNVFVRSSMHEALRQLVVQSFDATKWPEPLWGSLTTWGDRHIGDKVWQSKTCQGTSFMIGLFMKPDPEIGARLEDFRRLGVDLDEPIDNDFGGNSKRFSALSYAVAMRSTSAVGQLLSYGCDPQRLVRMEDDKPLSALSLAIENAAKQDQEQTKLSQSEHICAMLRAAVAKSHAMSVIEELGLDAPARP